jgi:hypothetical protein
VTRHLLNAGRRFPRGTALALPPRRIPGWHAPRSGSATAQPLAHCSAAPLVLPTNSTTLRSWRAGSTRAGASRTRSPCIASLKSRHGPRP